ncbi:MAG: hypothetical protein ACU833_02095 [Gammaproteobacteria bacterium]
MTADAKKTTYLIYVPNEDIKEYTKRRMVMSDTQHKLKIQAPSGINSADPNNDNLLHDLTAALTGGDAVFDFFSGNVQALQNLYQTIATSGDSVWIDGIDKNGMPVKYVDNGNHFLSIGSKIDDTDTLEKGTGSTTDYKQVGIAYVTLTTDQGTSQLIVNTIHYAGIGIAGIAATPALFKLLKPIVKAVAKFIKNLAVSIYNKVKSGFSTDDGEEAEDNVNEEASSAAEEASEEGVEVGESIFADVSFTILDGVGVVVAVGTIAVVLILELLSKQMTNWVRFYNVTQSDLQFGICWLKSSAGAEIAPAKVGETADVPKISKAPTPPWVTSSDTVIYRSDLQFINTNVLKGVGYVLNAAPSGDFPGFRVMVDIPNVGDNSIYVGFNTDDCSSVWDNNKDKNIGLTMKATSGKYTLRIATNKVSGKSPSPVNETEGYNYEHLIVLTDGSVVV